MWALSRYRSLISWTGQSAATQIARTPSENAQIWPRVTTGSPPVTRRSPSLRMARA